MAGRTPTELAELIAELRQELEVLRTRLELLARELESAELSHIRDRITKVESLLAIIDPSALVRHVATLQEQVTELKKWREETERKKWQFWLGVGICALTFTANLVMNLLLYFARKPG